MRLLPPAPDSCTTSVRRRLMLVLVLSLGLMSTVGAAGLRVITEQWPPYNYLQDGKPMGLAVEMAQAMLKDCGIAEKIEFLPWNRAYATAIRDPNVVLFTLGRNAEREPLFDWIFKISSRESWLYRLTTRTDIHLQTLNDAKVYKIGTPAINDIETQDFVNAGFVVGKNLDSIQSGDPYEQNLKKLLMGRIDLMPIAPLSLAHVAQVLGVPMKTLTPALLLNQGGPGYWLAISRNSDPALVAQLKASAGKLERQGVFKAIQDKYLHH